MLFVLIFFFITIRSLFALLFLSSPPGQNFTLSVPAYFRRKCMFTMDKLLSKHHGVLIIGAGFNGIIAAKTYLQINPTVDVHIIDAGNALGGVWSADRIYPGLVYELPCPMLNFSDLDMHKEMGIELWEDVTGYQVNELLVSFLNKSRVKKDYSLFLESLCSKTRYFKTMPVQHRGSGGSEK